MPANDLHVVRSSVDDSSPSERPDAPPLSSSVTRRTLLRLLSGGALALASGAVLAGCGGGGGGGGSNNGGSGGGTNPGTVTGTLNSSQIGGSNLLAQSVYQSDTPITNNKFTIKVSPQGAQLLLVSDGIGQVYALAVSVTGVSSLTIDATSTALALVFMTPGILATDPTVASTRLSQIAALSTFTPIVSFLASHLPTSPLSVLIAAGTLSGLVYSCVTDWFKTQTGSVKKPNIVDGFGFSADFGSLTNPSAVPVKLSNGELRRLNVVRCYVDANGARVGTPLLLSDALNGAQNLSLTSLFSTTSSTIASDTVDTTTPAVASVQYWVRGPGSSASSQSLPFDITSSETDAWIISIMTYLLVPLLEAALGLAGSFVSNQAFQDIADVWTQNSTNINISQVIADFANQNFQSAGSDLIKTILLPLIANNALMQALIQVLARDVAGASTLNLTLTPILTVFTLLSTVFEYPTCTGALTHWFALPHTSSVTLHISSGGITVS